MHCANKGLGRCWGDFGNLSWRGANFMCLAIVLKAGLCHESHDTESSCSYLVSGRLVVECALAKVDGRFGVIFCIGTSFACCCLKLLSMISESRLRVMGEDRGVGSLKMLASILRGMTVTKGGNERESVGGANMKINVHAQGHGIQVLCCCFM